MKRTYELVKEIECERDDVRQKLYRVSPPIVWEKDDAKQETEFLVASATTVLGVPETYLFAADQGGEIVSWLELPGSQKGTLDHEKVMSEWSEHEGQNLTLDQCGLGQLFSSVMDVLEP